MKFSFKVKIFKQQDISWTIKAFFKKSAISNTYQNLSVSNKRALSNSAPSPTHPHLPLMIHTHPHPSKIFSYPSPLTQNNAQDLPHSAPPTQNNAQYTPPITPIYPK